MRLPASIIGLWLLMALLGTLPVLQPHLVSLPDILAVPSSNEWLGNDELGRPVLDRLLAGAGVSLLVAVTAVSLSALIGIFVGLVAGYFGGVLDRVISRFIEVFLAFPGMLLAIAMAAMIGPGIDNVIIALTTMGWVGYARLVRVQVMTLRGSDHVLAAIALGQSSGMVMMRHLLPLVLAPVWA